MSHAFQVVVVVPQILGSIVSHSISFAALPFRNVLGRFATWLRAITTATAATIIYLRQMNMLSLSLSVVIHLWFAVLATTLGPFYDLSVLILVFNWLFPLILALPFTVIVLLLLALSYVFRHFLYFLKLLLLITRRVLFFRFFLKNLPQLFNFDLWQLCFFSSWRVWGIICHPKSSLDRVICFEPIILVVKSLFDFFVFNESFIFF